MKNAESTLLKKEKLLSHLSGFGLNPNQWSLKQKSKNIFLIQNKKSPSWSFLGISKHTPNALAWKRITLVSL